MNSKHEAIKAAYGEHWEKVKDYVEDNGWIELYSYNCYTDTVHTDLTEDLPFLKELGYERKYYNNGYTHYVRPKSLSGIENNNSWTRIESEEDLPKEAIECYFIAGEEMYMGWYNLISFNGRLKPNSVVINFSNDMVSHYQPIDQPKPPIF